MRLFDAHCHLQDTRILHKAPQLISTAIDAGVVRFAVNGVSEKDWHIVKELGNCYSPVIPCFGVHPWYVADRSPSWFDTLKSFFDTTPTAAIGEIGLDKGSRGREIDFGDQVEVFRKQLELAKCLKKPASVHCVRAFGDLLHIMKCLGPFPSGVILHSYLGSAEMVSEFAQLGAYFSMSGFLFSMKAQKAKKMLHQIPAEKLLLESDAPDALPNSDLGSLFLVDGDPSFPQDIQAHEVNAASGATRDASSLPKETLNQPANVRNVLVYVASLLEMSDEEVATLSYNNAMRLFSFEGSKVSSV